MGALTQVYVNPAIAGNSGTGTLIDPYGDLQYAFNTQVRDATNGDQFNVKAGTAEVLAASLTLATYGGPTAAAPLVLRGYTAAANDGGIAEINCNGVAMWSSAPNQTVLGWLYIHNGGNNTLVSTGTGTFVIHCEITKGASSPSGKALLTTGATGTVVDCYIHDAGSTGSGCTSGNLVYGCYIYNCVTGISNFGVSQNNLIVDCATGISFGNDYQKAINNSIYSSTASTGKGIYTAASNIGGIVMNNLIEGYSGAGGSSVTLGNDSCIVGNNAYYNCGAESLGDTRLSITSYTLLESPFVNPAGGNFSLKPFVSSAIETSYPVTWYGPTTTTNKCDIGAIQNGASSNWITKFQRSRRLAYTNR